MFRGRFIVVLFLCVSGVYGQSGFTARPVDDLLFKVAVYGPSDEIFIWWGHAALIVENTKLDYSRVFDWGIFSYPGDNFLKEFLKNQVRYKCTVEALNINMYIEEDRDIAVYTLDLDAEKKELILAYAENNVLPEHCYYDYHEFRDNCATRIRDIIDMGTGGQLKEILAAAPGRLSLRQHIRRFTWSRPFSGWFLDFLMGQDLDEPVTVWEEMFLPVEIGRAIANFRYRDSAGTERKLVRSIELINSTKKRPPILNAPLRRWPGDLALSVLAAIVCLGLDILRKKRPLTGRILWGAANSIVGLGGGAAGCVLVYGLFFMNNDYIQQNINILFLNPLLLAAVPLGICTAANKAVRIRPERILRLLWTGVFIAGLLTLLIKVLPPFFQQNQPVLALILPVAFVLSGLSGRLIDAPFSWIGQYTGPGRKEKVPPGLG
ncbi:MAG: DUF4105 domain-containing protein [Treponema sp.]|jgi:hypothetical protein|nr:DUF4105 domain-containing protein [Treponema sp.]